MEWWFLLLAGMVYFSYAYIAFSEHFNKNSYTYFSLCMLIGVFYNLLWYWSTRITKDKEDFFVLVLMWDVVYMAVFYFVPVFLFDVKVDKWGIIGMITMVIGIFIMKIGHHSG
jgi:hypothetical protein